jgi:hypothetical protein
MNPSVKERTFWRTIRRALLMVVKAIEDMFGVHDDPA